jgi:hypothetical protein
VKSLPSSIFSGQLNALLSFSLEQLLQSLKFAAILVLPKKKKHFILVIQNKI